MTATARIVDAEADEFAERFHSSRFVFFDRLVRSTPLRDIEATWHVEFKFDGSWRRDETTMQVADIEGSWTSKQAVKSLLGAVDDVGYRCKGDIELAVIEAHEAKVAARRARQAAASQRYRDRLAAPSPI